jgi:hypothetical protein
MRHSLRRTRFADVRNPDMTTGIEVMGSEMAVDEAQDSFNGAWIACGNLIDTMPAVVGDEYQSSWDDIGINVAMILHVDEGLNALELTRRRSSATRARTCSSSRSSRNHRRPSCTV